MKTSSSLDHRVAGIVAHSIAGTGGYPRKLREADRARCLRLSHAELLAELRGRRVLAAPGQPPAQPSTSRRRGPASARRSRPRPAKAPTRAAVVDPRVAKVAADVAADVVRQMDEARRERAAVRSYVQQLRGGAPLAPAPSTRPAPARAAAPTTIDPKTRAAVKDHARRLMHL